MIFKMIVLGHVLLASAFENKALHELQGAEPPTCTP